MDAQQPRLSVILIVRNEAHCLDHCLRSVADIADEIIVLDTGSSDGTQALARGYGAQVQKTDWPGFGAQKARALGMARGEWVLSIDADEHLTPQLAEEVRNAIQSGPPDINGYYLRYLNRWCGHPVRFGDWGSKRHIRLFRREKAHFTLATVHERAICDPKLGELKGLMIHDSIASQAEAWHKRLHYALLGAEALAAKRRGGLASAIGHSGWSLIRSLVLRWGGLDGATGWRVAWYNASGAWLKYRLTGQMAARNAGDFATGAGVTTDLANARARRT